MPIPELKKVLKLYTPHSVQRAFHESNARYRVAAWGRQSGKSTGGINDALKRSWKQPGGIYWIVSPTYPQARILYRRTVGMLWNSNILVKQNQSELRLKLINNSEIFFKSGDKPDNLRTATLHGAIIDEFRQQDPQLWPMVIRPMIATTQGWAAFLSTTNGFDHFYDLAEHAKSSVGKWEFFQAPSTCNPLFTEEEAQDARKTMSELQYRQEILAEFVNIVSARPYYAYSAENERDTCPFTKNGWISPYLPLIVMMDFNLSPMCWSLLQQHVDDFYMFSEIARERTNTQEMARALVDAVKDHKPGVILVGDATAKAGQRAAAGQSDYDIITATLSAAGIKYENMTPDANPPVKDRVNNLNAKLRSSDGKVHLWHHPSCTWFKRDMQRVQWKESVSGAQLEKKKDPNLTHSSDGVGYGISVLSPIPSIYDVGKLSIIRR